MSFEEESLYDLFGAEEPRSIENVRLPGEEVVEEAHAEHPEIEERPYQIECLAALSYARQRGEKRGLIHMATGLGKTTVAAFDVKQFLHSTQGARVLFVAHQNDILRQARERFSLILGEDKTYGMFTGEGRQGKAADVVFASFQLLHTSRDQFQPDDFDYIVVDESHHGKATTYEPSLLYFDPQFLLGMTATPDRRDLKEIRDIFGEEIYSKPLDKALSERLLARPEYHVILDNIAEALQTSEYKQLNRTLFVPKRDEEIAAIITKKLEDIERPKTIVFCPSVEHANRMAGLLPNAAALHSKRTKRERQVIMDSFMNNGLTTVTTVDLFNEGIDVADANAVVFLRSTESEVVFQQQLGRGLRKTPGKDSVLVLDFVASCDRLLLIDKVLGGHAKDDEATVTFDDINEDNDTVYELDFSLIDKLDEVDIERSEFQDSVRHIMEILRNIDSRAGTLMPAPEGWVQSTKLADELGFKNQDAFARRIKKLGITAVRYLGSSGRPSNHLSEQDAAMLRESSIIPDSLVSIQEVADDLGLGIGTIRRRMGHIALSIVKKYPHGDRARLYIHVDDIEKLRQTIETSDDLFTFNDAEAIVGLGHKTIKKYAEMFNLPVEVHYSEKGIRTHYVLRQSLERLREIIAVPEDKVLLSEVADDLGVSYAMAVQLAKNMEITTSSIITGEARTPKVIITREDFAKIREAYIAPDGWLSIEDICERTGIVRPAIAKQVEDLGIKTIRRHSTTPGRLLSAHMSPADAELIISQYTPPEGWMSLREIAAAKGVSRDVMYRRADQLGVKRKYYKQPKTTRAIPFVSAEDAEKLLVI